VLDLSAANLKPSWFSDGTLRDEVLDATLDLSPVVEPGMSPQPDKQLALKVRMRFWPKYFQEFVNIFLTAVFVLSGMILSLWFHYFIPNATGAVKVRRQIEDMYLKIKGISDDDLPSQPRTVLESTILSCKHRLRHDMPKFLPGFSSVLAEVQANVTMCSSWVDCAYSVAEVLGGAHRLLPSGLPPTLMNLIVKKCDHALHPFLSGFTKPEELQEMSSALKDAQKYLEAAIANSPVPDLEEIIKDRESRISPAIQQLRKDYPKHTGLFDQVEAEMKVVLSPALYRERDTFSLKTDLLLRYRDLALRAGATAFPPAVAAAAAVGGPPTTRPTALDRMAEHYDDFLAFVNTESYQSLNMARIYMAEMEQDFYPKALITELEKDPPAVEIHAAPSPVEPGVPVHYSLRFNREALNQVAAVQEWTLRWSFYDASNLSAETSVAVPPSAAATASPTRQNTSEEAETGWDIYHRFQEPGRHKVSVTLRDYKGDLIPTSKPLEIPVLMTADGRPTRGRWFKPGTWTAEAKIEGWRMTFVLLIALTGVFTTARQKVEQTGLFEGATALIGIGFAADIVKNALTDKPGSK
jgi:hypothetical protein